MPGKHNEKKHTPIVSKAQQSAMGVALAAKRGEEVKGGLRGPAKQMAESMSKTQLENHLKESKGKKLPKYVTKSNPTKAKSYGDGSLLKRTAKRLKRLFFGYEKQKERGKVKYPTVRTKSLTNRLKRAGLTKKEIEKLQGPK